MDVTCRRANELTSSDLAAWSRLQRTEPALDSPFFRPEFCLAAAEVRPGVEIAVVTEGEQTVAFFPFERLGAMGKPVGGRLSDYHGLIASQLSSPPAIAPPAIAPLLSACELRAWDFDHVPATQNTFRPHAWTADVSPYLAVGGGFDAYRATLRAEGVAELKQTERKARKLAREVGPLRLDWDTRDAKAWSCLWSWKSAQYHRTGVPDVLALPWVRALLDRIAAHHGTEFRGQLAVLRAGDTPLAVHFGMAAGGVLHWWFPTYDAQFGQYSPGRILLAELARQASRQGIAKIDLGRGLAPYKARAMSGATELLEGSVELHPVRRRLRGCWRSAKAWLRESPLKPLVRTPGRLMLRWMTNPDFNES